MIQSVLIVDDEPLAAQSLKRKLQVLDSSLNVRTETDPITAIDIIKTSHPQLLLLDISMPEISGFDLLDQLDDTCAHFVLIFCTAHSKYAIDAFEKSALDYLVKPVDPARLAMALEKARRAVTGKWIDRPASATAPMKKVVCATGRNRLWIDVSDIAWFSSENHETVVHDKGGIEHFCPLSLAAIEQKLDSSNFFRCHRSHIINREFIRHFHCNQNQVVLTPYPHTPVPVSRRLKQKFKTFSGM